MKYWDNVKKEDLEVIPGVFDEKLIHEVTWNSWLRYLKEMIDSGIQAIPKEVHSMLKDMLMDQYIDKIHVLEDRIPELEEIQRYLNDPETIKTIQSLQFIVVHGNQENWPKFVEMIRKSLEDN